MSRSLPPLTLRLHRSVWVQVLLVLALVLGGVPVTGWAALTAPAEDVSATSPEGDAATPPCHQPADVADAVGAASDCCCDAGCAQGPACVSGHCAAPGGAALAGPGATPELRPTGSRHGRAPPDAALRAAPNPPLRPPIA